MSLVDWLILIAGVAGLLVAGYGLVALTLHALRERRYIDIVLGVAVAVSAVLLLVAFGDRVMQ